MSLKIPSKPGFLELWLKEVIDECMASATERGMVYTRAAQYYYTGANDTRASLYNKIGPFVRKLSGFLMQPTDVRFQIVYDSGEDDRTLERSQLVSEKLTSDFREVYADIMFSEGVLWGLINGCQLLKVFPDGENGTFRTGHVHPQNFGVLSETTLSIDEQEAMCHVSYPTKSKLRTMLIDHPQYERIMKELDDHPGPDRDEEEPTYFHQMVVGGLQPLGDVGDAPSSAAGIVNVFPVPTPWRPQRRFAPTVKLCEVWIKDRDKPGDDWTTIQAIYGAELIIVEGEKTRRNLSRVPGKTPFVKIQANPTPGYFWGRSIIADVQMLQDMLNKRLRDIKIMWDRNVNAPQVFSGFTSVSEEQYFKIVNEGGFINDPNPNAKATKLLDPPPENYLEELEFIFKLFDEASGFSPIMSGQGESGVRAGVHAQTLVRTSSPQLIDQAARIERQLADCGYLAIRVMQAMDALIYTTADSKIDFTLSQLPDNFQVQVDSHSASPAFAEDNRQVAIALARAGAIDAEDLIHMLHPPGAELLLARLRQRQKSQAAQAKEDKQEGVLMALAGVPGSGSRRMKPGSGQTKH